MSAEQPTEIAKETFRRLASRKVPPTPENYTEIYSEVAGRAITHPSSAPLRDILAHTLTVGVSERLGYTPSLAEEALALAEACRKAGSPSAQQRLARDLKEFWFKLEVRGEAVDDIIKGLRTLLDILARNVADLVGDEPWLKGQIARAQALIGDPLDAKALGEAEKVLRDAAYKQAMIKQSLDEAKQALREFVSLVVERFTVFADATREYPGRFEAYAKKVEGAKSVHEISDVVAALVKDSRGLGFEVQRAQDELQAAREMIEERQGRVHELEKELEAVSELVSRDPLTEMLNRRGLEQAFRTEVARAERSKEPLAVALLDIDNFKALNTKHGHPGGDGALTHLAKVLRTTLRPTDTVARYGGEEFVLLLPSTDTPAGIEVMTRVQRELTKRFFLFNNEKVFVTFSAGVTEHRPGEPEASAIERADTAMRAAKAAGKNRVQAAK